MAMNFDRRVILAGLATLAAAPASAQPAPVAVKSGTEKAPLARRLAAYADSFRFADIDPPTIERTKVHLLDSLGCGLAAFREGTVRAVRELAFASGGDAATIIGTKRRPPLGWAGFANAAGIPAPHINDVYVRRRPRPPRHKFAACPTPAG